VQSNARVFCSQRAKAALALVVSDEEHSMMSSDWLRVASLLSEISRFVAWEKKKQASRTLIHDRHVFKAPSTRVRMFFDPQLFLSGYGYRPHAYGEFASKSGNFLIRSPEWKFLNPITFRIRVDGRIRIFSDTMTSQNWRKCLPRKFKYGRRSKAKSFCAPWAYFQSFSSYAVKCRSPKCWNKLCQKAARHLQALCVIYRTKRPAETT